MRATFNSENANREKKKQICRQVAGKEIKKRERELKEKCREPRHKFLWWGGTVGQARTICKTRRR